MATYAQIQTNVKTIIIDTPASIVGLVPSLINKAMRELQRRHNFKVMEATTSVTTTEGSHALTVQDDFKEMRDRPYWVDDTSGFYREIVVAPSRAAVIRQYTATDEGEPKVLLLGEELPEGTVVWEIWPLPDGNSDYDDGEYRLVIPYWKYLNDLSASTDTNWFTNRAEWYLTYQAVAEAFMIDWDEERAALWAQKAQNEFSQVLLADKNARFMSVDTWVPYLDVFEAQLKD